MELESLSRTQQLEKLQKRQKRLERQTQQNLNLTQEIQVFRGLQSLKCWKKKLKSNGNVALTNCFQWNRPRKSLLVNLRIIRWRNPGWNHPYQLLNLQRFKRQVENNRGLLIADEPGLGKTVSSIISACSLIKKGQYFSKLRC